MSLKEKVYSVLIVSASEKFNQVLPDLFPVSTFSPVNVVSSVSAAKRAASERDFDFIILNAPLPDDTGMGFAADAINSYNTVVLFLARTEQYDDAYAGNGLPGHGNPAIPAYLRGHLRRDRKAEEQRRITDGRRDHPAAFFRRFAA